MFKQNIIDNIRDVELYTMIADDTTDKNRNKIQGFACDYFASFTIEENYLSIKGTNNRSAKEIFSFIKDTLADFKIFKDGLISQSYNGASIISGDYSGLQIFISNFCRYFKSFLDLFHTYIIFCKWFIL